MVNEYNNRDFMCQISTSSIIANHLCSLYSITATCVVSKILLYIIILMYIIEPLSNDIMIQLYTNTVIISTMNITCIV